MLQIISDSEKVDRYSWSQFVENHPRGNIFHTPEIYQVFKETDKMCPTFICIMLDEEIVGILVGVISFQYSGIFKFFSSRSIVYGGPLAKDNNYEIINELIASHNNLVKNKVIYTQYRNYIEDKKYSNAFLYNGFKYDPHLDIYINLNQKIDDYWNSLKSKLRQNIRKAEKNNIEVRSIQNEEEVRAGYRILTQVYKEAKLPLQDISMFINTLNILVIDHKAMFLAAYKDDLMIGIRLVLLYKNIIYDWYSGSNKDYYHYYPNDILPFKVIEWGINHTEYELFIFGGAGKPNIPYGVRDHKLKFSSNLVEPGRFEKINHNLAFYLSRKAFNLWRKLI